MCGRGACSLDPDTLKRVCNVNHFVNSHHYSPSYNICPSTFIPVLLQRSQMDSYYVLNGDDSKTDKNPNTTILSAMRWGLIPSFSKTNKMQFNTINARQDTVTSKPMYRRLVNRKRCVVLMNGYYEWKTTNQPNTANTATSGKSRKSKKVKPMKQPYYFTPKYSTNGDLNNVNIAAQLALDPPLMYMAALWDVWKSKEDPLAPPLFTVTVITTSSSEDVSFCHHRMPLLMARECVDQWVDVETYSIEQCFKSIAASQSTISIRNKAVPRNIVGNVRNKGIECIQSVDEHEVKQQEKTRKGGLHKFFQSVPSSKTSKNMKTRGTVKGNGSGMDIDSQTDNDTDCGMMDEQMKEAVAASKESYVREQERGKKRKLEDVTERVPKRQKLNDKKASSK